MASNEETAQKLALLARCHDFKYIKCVIKVHKQYKPTYDLGEGMKYVFFFLYFLNTWQPFVYKN